VTQVFNDLAARRPRLLLVLYCLLCWLPGFFSIPPGDRDESRFAQATMQMIESGNLLEIRNGAEARNRKPIGIYWLQLPFAAAARATGIAEANPIWPYRLPSLSGALVAVLATYGLGRRLLGREAALLGAMMLGGSVLLAVETDMAKTDAALLAATTLAMTVLARAYTGEALTRGAAALFWLALGAGILIKGPITPLVAGLTALTLVAVDRRATWLRMLRPRWGVVLMLAVVLPWFVAIGIATHGAFFRESVGGDLGRKLAGGDDGHGAPPGYYLLLLALTLFPAGFIVLRALPASWAARREPVVRFLLAWAIPAWIVFEVVPTKLPHYPLPIYPALCLLAAHWLADPARRPPPRWLAFASGVLFVAAAAVLGLGAASLPVVLAPGAWGFDLIGLPGLAAAVLVAVLVLRAGETQRAVLAGLIAAPLLYWAVLEWELPRMTPLWIGPRVETALEAHGAWTGFATAGYAEPSLVFRCGTDTALLPDGGAAAHFLADAPGRVVLVEGREMARFEAEARLLNLAPRSFSQIDGFNYSNGRRVALTLFERQSGMASDR
jgi:4-amino-4-deoxy-L-arabinose transferase-like glycosyltransferase